MTSFNQLDTVDIPSIVPTVTDSTGASMTDVQLKMDGEVLATRLDGQPLAVDPGLHEFSFVAKDQVVATRKIMIVQGQQSRSISISVESSQQSVPSATVEKSAPSTVVEKPMPPPSPSRGTNALVPLVLGAAGIACAESVALGVFLGKDDTLSAAADVGIGISIGVGAAAVVATVWAFLTPRAADQRAPGATAVRLTVQPGGSGAVAGLTGSF